METNKSKLDLEIESLELSKWEVEKITDQEVYNDSVKKLTDLSQWLKSAEAAFDPEINEAHQEHKNLIAQKKEVVEPVEKTLRTIKIQIAAFDAEQQRIRRAEQLRLEQEAQDRLNADRERHREAMKSLGHDAETAAEIADETVIRTVVSAPTAYEKSKGVVIRETWKARITDFHALVKAVAKDKSKCQLLVGIRFEGGKYIASPGLNRQAVSLKNFMSIPGVEAYSDKGVAAR